MDELDDVFADEPHICGVCQEVLQPTLRAGVEASVQWLHLDPQTRHAPEPLLLPPSLA